MGSQFQQAISCKTIATKCRQWEYASPLISFVVAFIVFVRERLTVYTIHDHSNPQNLQTVVCNLRQMTLVAGQKICSLLASFVASSKRIITQDIIILYSLIHAAKI